MMSSRPIAVRPYASALGAEIIGVDLSRPLDEAVGGCLAYETLSDGMRALLERLRGMHDSLEPKDHSHLYKGMRLQERKGAKREIRPHPMVRAHPVTGRRSLFISPSYCFALEGLTGEESRPPAGNGLQARDAPGDHQGAADIIGAGCRALSRDLQKRSIR
jgi:alpha-ketoglutarate-dependent taurine dioxygenase